MNYAIVHYIARLYICTPWTLSIFTEADASNVYELFLKTFLLLFGLWVGHFWCPCGSFQSLSLAMEAKRPDLCELL